jgi:hypothetical protein
MAKRAVCVQNGRVYVTDYKVEEGVNIAAESCHTWQNQMLVDLNV